MLRDNGSRSNSGSRNSGSRSSNNRREYEEDRNQLLRGARGSGSGSRSSHGGDSGERYGRQITRDRMDDSRYLQDQTKKMQTSDLEATRQMIQLLEESKQVSESSLGQLQRQGESLQRSELKALKTNVSAKQAREEARDLRKYSKLFAISWPSWTKSRQRKELERAEKALKNGELQMLEDEMAMRHEEREKLAAADEASRRELVGSMDDNFDKAASSLSRVKGGSSSSSSARRQNHRSSESEWAEKEDELDANISTISHLLADLKVNASSMGARLADQTKQIERIQQSTDNTSATLSYTKKSIRKA